MACGGRRRRVDVPRSSRRDDAVKMLADVSGGYRPQEGRRSAPEVDPGNVSGYRARQRGMRIALAESRRASRVRRKENRRLTA